MWLSGCQKEGNNGGQTGGKLSTRGPPPSLRKRGSKGSEEQGAMERPAHGHHLNQDPHHTGPLTSPKMNQQQSVNPE